MTAPRYNVTETEARLFLQQMPISILPTPPIQTSQPLFPQNQLPHSSSPLQPYSQNYVQSPTPQIQAPFMHQQNLQRKASITELDEPYMYLYHHEKMEMDELAERTLAQFSYKIEAKDGQEEHVCPLCAKRFGMKHNLRNHIIIHFHLRPFHCGICEATFVRRWDLKRHMKVHSKNKN